MARRGAAAITNGLRAKQAEEGGAGREGALHPPLQSGTGVFVDGERGVCHEGVGGAWRVFPPPKRPFSSKEVSSPASSSIDELLMWSGCEMRGGVLCKCANEK